MLDIDDLLGPATPPAPIPAPVKVRKRKPRKANTKKVDDLIGKRRYEPLKAPKAPVPGGIFAAREAKGQNLGRTCLNPECKAVLKHKGGRPPVICRKTACFRYYRNLYRHDYDRVRGN